MFNHKYQESERLLTQIEASIAQYPELAAEDVVLLQKLVRDIDAMALSPTPANIARFRTQAKLSLDGSDVGGTKESVEKSIKFGEALVEKIPARPNSIH